MKEKYELAYKDYLNGMKQKEIADKYEVSVSAVKNWKSRYWSSQKLKPKMKKVSTKKVSKKEAKKIVENLIDVNGELSEDKQLFCIYYLKYHNAVKAYLKVKPNAKYTSAVVMASRWKNDPEVIEELKRLKKEMYTDALLDPQDIVQKYIDIAFTDENDIDGVIVKLSDCMRALEWLDKHMGMASEEQRAKIDLLKAQKDKITNESTGSESVGVTIINDLPK